MSNTALSKNKTIAYWVDGFWMSSVKEAETMDMFDAFGTMKHSTIDVPEAATEDEITALVGNAIEALEPKTVETKTASDFQVITREEDGLILDVKDTRAEA